MKHLTPVNPNALPDHIVRSTDFFFAKPGQLATLGMLLCTDDRKRSSCGCGRSFGDIQSSQASTIFMVAEREESKLWQQFQRSRWVKEHCAFCRLTPKQLWELVVTPVTHELAKYQTGELFRVSQSPTNFLYEKQFALHPVKI